MVPQLMLSVENEEVEKYTTPERKKKVKWEDEMRTASDFKLTPKDD